MALKTSGIDRYDEMLLLDDRSSAQIQVVAPGGLSIVATARRGRSMSIRWGPWGRGAPWAAQGVYGVVKKRATMVLVFPFSVKTQLKHRRNIAE